MHGKFEELAVIIQIESTISKYLPVRCIVCYQNVKDGSYQNVKANK